jgi:hypothetical protein
MAAAGCGVAVVEGKALTQKKIHHSSGAFMFQALDLRLSVPICGSIF